MTIAAFKGYKQENRKFTLTLKVLENKKGCCFHEIAAFSPETTEQNNFFKYKYVNCSLSFIKNTHK